MKRNFVVKSSTYIRNYALQLLFWKGPKLNSSHSHQIITFHNSLNSSFLRVICLLGLYLSQWNSDVTHKFSFQLLNVPKKLYMLQLHKQVLTHIFSLEWLGDGSHFRFIIVITKRVIRICSIDLRCCPVLFLFLQIKRQDKWFWRFFRVCLNTGLPG